MQTFDRHRGIAVPFAQRNIDTDQILPARFLHRVRADGFGDVLFKDLRERQDGTRISDFVLNRSPYRDASILVADSNFGCGSAREHAVWALADFGFRVAIAPSFGDIFFNNSIQNGFLAIVLQVETVGALLARLAAEPGLELDVDLGNQTIRGDGIAYGFEVGDYQKKMLGLGLSETEMTLGQLGDILSFEAAHHDSHAWLSAPVVPEEMRNPTST